MWVVVWVVVDVSETMHVSFTCTYLSHTRIIHVHMCPSLSLTHIPPFLSHPRFLFLPHTHALSLSPSHMLSPSHTLTGV